jgi:hypothetical protein
MTHATSGARSRMPRVGSAAQLGQQLGPVGQLLLDHGAQNRLIDVPVHLVPVDTPNGGWGSYSIASWTIRAVGSSVRRATRARAMSMQRTDQIQQGEPWVEHERDRVVLLGCHVHAPLAVRCCVTSTGRLWHLLVGDSEAEDHVMPL